MRNLHETNRRRSLEELVQNSTRVAISYVISGEIGEGGGHLELSGQGISALTELRKRFGKKGIDAFNREFISDRFLSELEERGRDIIERLKYQRPTFEEDTEAFEREFHNEKEALNGFLKKMESGRGFRIMIGDFDYKERRIKKAKKDPKEITYITLRKP